MDRDQLQATLSSLASNVEFEEGGQWLNVTIPSKDWRSLAEKLRNDESLEFDFLFCLTGIDWPDYMSVVYHLNSTTHGHNLVVKAKIDDREKPQIETVCDIWRTAEFHEREVFDLFGITFLNHPDLRRIFLTDDWVGFPLRKDYVDEVNIVDF